MGQLVLCLPATAIAQVTDPITAQATRIGLLDLWMPPPPLTLDLRLHANQPCPIEPSTAHEASALRRQLEQVAHLFDDVDCYWQRRQVRTLSAEQIRGIKQASLSHPSVLLFIHGFNVGMGAYGKQLLTHKMMGSTTDQVMYHNHPVSRSRLSDLYFCNRPATIYRDPDYYPQPLNGNADHHWWVSMEYQLNLAAGFQGFDWHYQPHQPSYTRVLNIAWSGDPVSPLDYMAVEPMALLTAHALMPTILQLQAAGIEVNCVAHSAGNIVLIQLMQLLATAGHYRAFKHVFLWQAAMPNNVLSPNAGHQDNSLTGFWQTGRAYQSASHITVLYSHHDNVLGPIPISDMGHHQTALADKWKTPDGPPMAAMAVAVDVIDQQLGVPNALKSCYHVAHLFHVPFNTLLFDRTCRVKLYERLYQLHRTVHMQVSLADQIDYIRHSDPQAFNDLSLFISLYAAIKHDGVMSFLASLKNSEKLMKLSRHLAPWELEQLQQNIHHALSVTIDQHGRHQVYIALIKAAKKRASFSYLKCLWQRLEFSAHDFFKWAKAVDFLLQYRYIFLEKEPQITFEIWQSLMRMHRQHQNKPPVWSRAKQVLNRGEETAALIITVLNTPGLEPHPAMGYSGIDTNDTAIQPLLSDGHIHQVDQTRWLFHHGAMRAVQPESALFKHVYQGVIMSASGMNFGQWPVG